MVTGKKILSLVLLPCVALAAGAQPMPQKQVGAEGRMEVETSRHIPLDAYNESVGRKAAHYCALHACDTPPKLRSASAPVYPPAALRAGVEGRAIMAFDIDASGKPVNLVVESATAPEFGEAGLEAVRSWRFQPAVLNGKAIEYRGFRQAFPFELRD